MFRLNFKIALRNIWKNRTSSLINIWGLAIGLSACLLLLLYASYEWNYDQQFQDSEQIYQPMVNAYDGNGQITRTLDLTQNVLAATLKQDFPEIEHIGRTTNLYKRLFTVGDHKLKLDGRYADPDFLRVFNYQFISGNPDKALNDPYSVILTEKGAKRLFGTTAVLNRTVRFENQVDLKVTAVIKDLPANVTYTFEALAPWALFANLNKWPLKENWGNHSFYTVLKLRKDADASLLNTKIKDIVRKHFALAKEDIFIYPLTKLHLYGQFMNGKSVGGKIRQVKIFVGLSLGILLIACINFMNLSTAYAQKRAKEIGIKKTIGATKMSLILQFLLESLILTSISIFISIAIVELCLPWFNHLLEIEISIDYYNPLNWIILLTVMILTGLLAGSYPAFYLSGFNPIQTLKRPLHFKTGFSLSLRQLLVIVQFTFAVILIASTITIYRQLQYIKNRPLGYQANALVEIPHEGLLYANYELLKTRLLADGAVTGVTQSSSGVTHKDSSIRGLEWEGMSEADQIIDFDQIYTTYDFLKTTGIKLLEGRDFSKKFASDSTGLLLSKKAVQVMGLKHPIGARIVYQGEKRTVVGVFDDIVWGDRSKLEVPMVIAFANGISESVTMRLNPQKSISESISSITRIVRELNPNFPVDIQFIDNLNEAKLKNEATLAKLANVFGALAIFISCLGLFGLSAYSAAQRTKEIGIRKVLGASIRELMSLLSLNFVRLVLISIILASPIAYYVMDKWLQSFEVQTPMSIWIFILTGTMTILIALLTVSWQTFKAAKANPVKALKYE